MPVLKVDTATDGATLVPAPGSRQFIRVLGLDLGAAAALASVSLKSNNSTVIWISQATQVTPFQANLNVDSQRTIDCNPGESLNLGLASGVNVKGSIEYVIYGPPQ